MKHSARAFNFRERRHHDTRDYHNHGWSGTSPPAAAGQKEQAEKGAPGVAVAALFQSKQDAEEIAQEEADKKAVEG